MNDKHTDRQRRQALKKILAGSSIVGASTVVPDTWVKPIVNAVVLPAHAQASPPLMLPMNAAWAGGSMTSIEPRSGEGLAKRLLDQIVPKARAGDDMSVCPAGVIVCLDTIKVGENQVNVRLAVIPGPQGRGIATVVNGQIQPPIVIEGYTVTGALSSDAQTWMGTVQGRCPPMNGIKNVGSDGVFTGDRIDVAALQLAQLSIPVPYGDLDEAYTATLNAACGIIM